MAEPCTLGVDLGGTKIKLALVAGDGRILADRRLSTDADGGPGRVRDQIVEACRDLQEAAPTTPAGLGVGVAGQVRAADGVVRFAPNLGWHDVPLQAELQRELQLPVVLVNDVRAATWAEWRFGAGQGCADLVCLFVGTGIGGGIVSDGRILAGSSNSAGEIGHMTVDLHGPPCHCDNRGCFEALAGGWAIARRAREAVLADPGAGAVLRQLAADQGEELSAAIVAAGLRAGDPLARRIVDEVTLALIAGCVGLVNAFNPRRLILGGGVIDGLPELVARIDQGIRQRALAVAGEGLEVVATALGSDAGVIGAAAVALNQSQEKGAAA
ncbi:ROK family protein [Desulfuromonas carbonis]|uniref:ROK family protein n=1 Tax=Desulfuromonas sp. DDH964 TaxID=1823759 RepID=UPI00078E9052|nr:ROK family protein [Desulfuromonas sp. DDH964]AMV72870.1 ROK domain transcriptional regulator/sugar kinase [Desulfuromonas sp. DDH964]